MLAAKGGDAEAFTVLARRYSSKLVAHCRALTRDAEVAREAAQETWLGRWSGRSGYEPSSPFVVYLFTAARNRCRNAHRTKARAGAALGVRGTTDVDTLASASPSGLDQVLAEERRRHLSERIDTLSVPLREALVLRVTNELSYAHIAAILGVPEATARTRVHLAVQKLRELASKEDA